MSRFSDRRISWRNALRSAMACRVKYPCFNAFVLPLGAPDPGAPPCIRHRRFPLTAGALQDVLRRVLAPQRGLRCMEQMSRLWPSDIITSVSSPGPGCTSLRSCRCLKLRPVCFPALWLVQGDFVWTFFFLAFSRRPRIGPPYRHRTCLICCLPLGHSKLLPGSAAAKSMN